MAREWGGRYLCTDEISLFGQLKTIFITIRLVPSAVDSTVPPRETPGEESGSAGQGADPVSPALGHDPVTAEHTVPLETRGRPSP
jgi:hypothetical protein